MGVNFQRLQTSLAVDAKAFPLAISLSEPSLSHSSFSAPNVRSRRSFLTTAAFAAVGLFSLEQTAATTTKEVPTAQATSLLDFETALKQVTTAGLQQIQAARCPDTGLYLDVISYKTGEPIAVDNSHSRVSPVASGYGLTGLVMSVEQGLISKEVAAQQALQTLKTLQYCQESYMYDLMEDPAKSHRGWFYHFYDNATCSKDSPTKPSPWIFDNGAAGKQISEVSTVDTYLAVMNALIAGEYFGGECKTLAEKIFANVDYKFMLRTVVVEKEGKKEERIMFAHGIQEYLDPNTPRKFIECSWDQLADGTGLYSLWSGAKDASVDLWYKSFDPAPRPELPLFTAYYLPGLYDFSKVVDSRGLDLFAAARDVFSYQKNYCQQQGFPRGLHGLTACAAPDGGYGVYHPGCKEIDKQVISPLAVAAFLPMEPDEVKSQFEIWNKLGLDFTKGLPSSFRLDCDGKLIVARDLPIIDVASTLLLVHQFERVSKGGRSQIHICAEKSPILDAALTRIKGNKLVAKN